MNLIFLNFSFTKKNKNYFIANNNDLYLRMIQYQLMVQDDLFHNLILLDIH